MAVAVTLVILFAAFWFVAGAVVGSALGRQLREASGEEEHPWR